jgi:hypothetical protein
MYLYGLLKNFLSSATTTSVAVGTIRVLRP